MKTSRVRKDSKAAQPPRQLKVPSSAPAKPRPIWIEVPMSKALFDVVTQAARAEGISPEDFVYLAIKENIGRLESGELKPPGAKGGAK